MTIYIIIYPMCVCVCRERDERGESVRDKKIKCMKGRGRGWGGIYDDASVKIKENRAAISKVEPNPSRERERERELR